MSNYHFRDETATLDDAARAGVSGQYVRLADGITHYELGGPADGPCVVLVHGFSVPYYIWDPTFAALTQAGLRTLRYDLFGRGYSDHPNVVYNADLFDRQLVQLLDALGFSAPVDVAGLSLGGPITATFVARHPERVRRWVLFDPAGLQVHQPLAARLTRVPWLGEWLFDLFGRQVLVSGQHKDLYQPERFPDYASFYLPTTRFVGFRRALLSTLRHGPMENMQATFRQAAAHGHPTLLIWGRADQTVPFAVHRQFLDIIPQVEFHAIEQAAHVPHIERPEVVNPILIEFLCK